MPSNKDFAQRIEIIDSCLMRKQRRWTLDELLDDVNRKLQEQYDTSVSKRTLQYDLEYLINEKQAPIEKKRLDEKVTYTYAQANYSIKNLPINEEEISYLKDAIEILRSVSDLLQEILNENL